MHSGHNYRHSRRSACDRCRGQKLRCERAHMNGMSCERCLKAQEMCITSINQPTAAILPSNQDYNILTRHHQGSGFNENRDPMSLLHKSFGSKVKKSFHPPSTIMGRYVHGCWGESATLPLLPEDKLLTQPEDNSFDMSLHFANGPVPSELWENHHYWPTGAHSPVYSEYIPTEQNTSSSKLYSDNLLETKSDPNVAIKTPHQRQCPDYTGLESSVGSRNVSHFDWANYQDLAISEGPIPSPIQKENPPSQQDVRKRLLRLKDGLLEDLDLLGNGSNVIAPSLFAHDHFSASIETLNLPISRLLEHSSSLLDIVQSLCGTTGATDEDPNLTPSTKPPQFQNPSSEDPFIHHSDAGDSGLDESVTTMSSLDSGYQTTIASPDRMTTTTSPKYDITMWLSVLEAHCYLSRIYRAVFTRLYQLLLIIPPADAATFLLLPKFQYGEHRFDTKFTGQVKVLVEIASKMMWRIDRALGLRSSSNRPEVDGEPSSLETFRENDWSVSLRDFVLAQEQDPCEMSLMEIMKCLRQLVGDTVIT